MSTPDGRMVEVLAAHEIRFECDGDYGEVRWVECTCDYLDFANWTGGTEADHRAHVAAALTEAGFGHVADAKADALREAADDLQRGRLGLDFAEAAEELEVRAARIETEAGQ